MRVDLNLIIWGVVAIIFFAFVTSFIMNKYSATPPDEGGSWACTADAKICPDGSAVGRVPPYCHFAPCPGE